jgi:uncharacterized protein (TIGR02444 family)
VSAAPSAGLAAESWAFMLAIYAREGVAEACLRLQDEASADVLLLLTVAFAARRGILLSATDIAEMDAICRPWREKVVRPLRAVRIALKSGPPPAPSAATEALRSHIKADELTAERLQNDLLADWLAHKAPSSRAVTRDELRKMLGDVVLHPEPLIDVIADAAVSIPLQAH